MNQRVLISVVTLIIVWTTAATTATAQFTGTPTAGLAGEGVFTLETGRSFTCTSAKTTTPGNSKTALDLGAITWNTCGAIVGESKLSTQVTCNRITLEQPTKEGTANGSATAKLVLECSIVLVGASCTINLPTANQKLGRIDLKKEAAGVLQIVELSAIKATVKGSGCGPAGLGGPYNAATLKIPSLKGSALGLE